MAWMDEEDFENAARKMRIRLGVDDQLRPDMCTVIVKLKHAGLIANYARVPDDQASGDEAWFDPETRVLHIRESTFRAANATFEYSDAERHRARFTIAHEIGHVALGHTQLRYRGTTSALAEQMVSKIRNEEYAANKFAAAFLAPAHLSGSAE